MFVPAERAESLARWVGLLLWPAESLCTRSAVAGCATARCWLASASVKMLKLACACKEPGPSQEF